MNNRPDPSDDKEGGQKLQDAINECLAVEFITSEGGDNGADTREYNIENEAHDGQSFVKLHDGAIAAACLFLEGIHFLI